MNKIIKKSFLRIRFTTSSPLIVGSGKNENTDNDIVLNGEKIPFIPGTAVAGVTRSMFADEKLTKRYFGYVPGYEDAASGQKAISSKIVFYDANLDRDKQGKDEWHVSKRDFVKLDDWKVAEKKGAKFDMEILEPGVKLTTYIEQNFGSVDEEDYLDRIAAWWKSGNIRFGAKTMRGFGRITVDSIEKVTIDTSNNDDIRHWLNHTMYEEEFWNGYSTKPGDTEIDNKEKVLKLELEIQSSVSIRSYTTEVTEEDDLVAKPDYRQLSVHGGKNGKGIPVIPGTSWAGAFRSNMRRLVPSCDREYFGSVNKKRKERSGILFSESRIKDSSSKIITRNAIDRFSGGTIKNALYTEQTEYGGQTELEIRLCRENPPEDMLKTLAASVADLHAGLLSVGGLTSVGRGLIKVTEVNGKPFDGDAEKAGELYEIVLNELTGEKG